MFKNIFPFCFVCSLFKYCDIGSMYFAALNAEFAANAVGSFGAIYRSYTTDPVPRLTLNCLFNYYWSLVNSEYTITSLCV